jgi:hypothetical protein
MGNHYKWIDCLLLQALLQRLPKGSTRWFVYSDILEFELLIFFRFQTIYSDVEELKILSHLVRPSLLLVEIRHGREKPPTSYEFYFPSIVARQIGFGQLPPVLFFADKLKPREVVTTSLEFDKFFNLRKLHCQKPSVDGIVFPLPLQPTITSGRSGANTYLVKQHLFTASS